MKLKGNIFCFDIESGGLDPKATDLLSIGFVMVKDGVVVHEEEIFVKKDVYRASVGALKVNGLNLIDVYNNGKTVEEIKEHLKMLVMCKFGGVKATVVGHNVGFDLGFAHEHIMPKVEWEKLFSYRNVDTAGIARYEIDKGNISIRKADLSSLMEYFGMGSEQSKGRHSSLFDAKMTLEVYKKLLSL